MNGRKIPIISSEASADKAKAPEDKAEFRVIDRRPFADLDPDAPVEPPAEIKPRYPTYVEELMAKVADTERRFAERVKLADQEVIRSKSRLQQDFERELSLARQKMLLPFLDVLDNLERALKAASTGGSKEDLIDGLRMTAGLFRSQLKAQTIEPIEVLERPFDPNLSQAIGMVSVEDPARDGLVVDEVLPGYLIAGSLLRPAQVRVGKYQKNSA